MGDRNVKSSGLLVLASANFEVKKTNRLPIGSLLSSFFV